MPMTPVPTSRPSVLERWVEEIVRLAEPARVQWCDGSAAEAEAMVAGMLKDGTLIPLNPDRFPGSYLHRSHPSDVARTEKVTFICTPERDGAGPTNHWLSVKDGLTRIETLFRGAMRGRTMYVVPYVMGPPGSPFARAGVEITDSPYVVANMRIMTRMGEPGIDLIRRSGDFVRGVHALGDLDPGKRCILHFPSTREIWSFASGYGGNALLGKKCHALRIASWQGRQEGWMAEHMLIAGIEDPHGRVTYFAAAFPSQCGKTNLAMLVPPASMKGWKLWTVGDDIAWLHPGPDGCLWAVNPEAGFFGVAPGTGPKTNPNAMAALRRNSIFTNVALRPDGTPWWEGMEEPAPPGTVDWQGRPWDPAKGKAAHPNSRFTTPAAQCPSISSKWDAPEGVPISFLVFGGRRARVAPLVYQAYSWPHGVYTGATMASETTAAATGAVGVVRRDPFAMLPFCGYNMADYFDHWLSMGRRLALRPPIFHVNWFRKDAGGNYLWPGYGENLRVLRWMIERSRGQGPTVDSPAGWVPAPGAIDTDGLNLPPGRMEELLAVDPEAWREDLADQEKFLDQFGTRLPTELWNQYGSLRKRLEA